MVDRRPKLLFDAISAMDTAILFMAGKDMGDYSGDLLLRSGVERQLEILGEACARLSRVHASLFTDHPAAEKAVALRNRIIHGDDAIDDQIIFDVVVDDLPELRAALHAWLMTLTAHD